MKAKLRNDNDQYDGINENVIILNEGVMKMMKKKQLMILMIMIIWRNGNEEESKVIMWKPCSNEA